MTELLSRIFVKNHKDVKDASVRKRYGTLSSFVGIFVNMILSATKLILGLITASAAIIADALNNLSDAGSSIITLVSFKLSSKPADRDHPFGHARFEYIASLAVAFLILLVGFETATTSIGVLFGFSESESPTFSAVSIIILGISIIFKLWLALFYRKIGKKIDSSVIKASSVDSIGDCVSTFAVLVCAIIIKFTNFELIDTIVSIAVSILIIIAGIKILIETKNSLLGEAPVDEQIDAIKEIINEYPDILDIHDLMLHNYGPNRYICSFHAEVDGAKNVFVLHDMIDNVERRIQTDLNILCTVHMDPIVTDDETVNEMKAFLIDVIKEDVASDISIHDFRIVVGNTHTNMIFDVVLPFESNMTEDEVKEKISAAVMKKRESCYCVITIDRG